MGRSSTSSDNSSTLSTSPTLTDSTVYSYSKDTEAPEKQRRSLRQKARDVVSDLGYPPTHRQDIKEGKPTKKYNGVSLMGSGLGRAGLA